MSLYLPPINTYIHVYIQWDIANAAAKGLQAITEVKVSLHRFEKLLMMPELPPIPSLSLPPSSGEMAMDGKDEDHGDRGGEEDGAGGGGGTDHHHQQSGNENRSRSKEEEKEKKEDTMIILSHLSYSWKTSTPPSSSSSTHHHHQTLNDINLELPGGKMLALVGHVGAGKSTLLLALLGELEEGEEEGEGRIGGGRIKRREEHVKGLQPGDRIAYSSQVRRCHIFRGGEEKREMKGHHI